MGRGEGELGRGALGFRVKSGWALAIALTGDRDHPRVRSRSTVALADPSVPESSHPYHPALDAPGPRGRAIVSRLVAVVEDHTARSVAEFLESCGQEGWKLRGAGLVVGSEADPGTITNDHIRAHAEEGRLFRRVLEEALARAGLAVTVTIEKKLYAAAASHLNRTEGQLRKDVTVLGRTLGGPWRVEEKTASIAAWMVL